MIRFSFFLLILSIDLINCLIAEDLNDLANHLTEQQCKVLQVAITNQPIGQINSSCFDFLIDQRIFLRTKYPREGDQYFKDILTRALTDLGLEGSAIKLINLDLRENIISVNVNQFARLEEIREEEEAEAADAIAKNPFKSMSSSSPRNDRLVQQSNRMVFDFAIMASAITMAIFFTYLLIVFLRNFDVPDELIDHDQVIHVP